MTKFVENIYHLLEYNGISKKQFLSDLHLGKNAISNWESRNSVPNGKTLIEIADYFNVSLDYLVGRQQTKVE